MDHQLFDLIVRQHEADKRQRRLVLASRILWLVSIFFVGVAVGVAVS